MQLSIEDWTKQLLQIAELRSKSNIIQDVREAMSLSDTEIIEKSAPYQPPLQGIYFLVKDDEIVYVGQSVDISARVKTHRDTMLRRLDAVANGRDEYPLAPIFDRVTMLQVKDNGSLLFVEAYFIRKFLPKFNRMGLREIQDQKLVDDLMDKMLPEE